MIKSRSRGLKITTFPDGRLSIHFIAIDETEIETRLLTFSPINPGTACEFHQASLRHHASSLYDEAGEFLRKL